MIISGAVLKKAYTRYGGSYKKQKSTPFLQNLEVHSGKDLL